MLINRRSLLKAAAMAGVALPFQKLPAFGQANRNIIRVGLSDYPANLRPGKAPGGIANRFVWSLMHIRLLRYNTSGALEGELAESWSHTDGVWEFKIKDVKFSDGNPVTSADLQWSIERMGTDDVGFTDRASFANIVEFESPDERTLRFKTKTPNSAIPHLLAHSSFYVLAKDSDADLEQGIGAGPYLLESAERGVQLSFVPNPGYYQAGLPKPEKVQVISYLDENLRVSALIAGDVDIIDYVPWSAMSSIESTPGLALDQINEGAFMYMTFSGKGVFADARLRKAASFALRRDEIVQSVFYGRGAEMNGPPRPQAGDFYNEDNANYWRYDPDLARSLMQEAGVPDGFSCTMLATSQYAFHRDTAMVVQAQLAEIGIKATLILPDWATRLSMGAAGEGDLGVIGGGGETLDPASVTFIDPNQPVGSSRSHGFVVPDLTELRAKGIGEFDLDKRREIYAQIDKLALENTTYCGLAYRAAGFARSEQLTGFELLPSIIALFSYMKNDTWAYTS